MHYKTRILISSEGRSFIYPPFCQTKKEHSKNKFPQIFERDTERKALEAKKKTLREKPNRNAQGT